MEIHMYLHVSVIYHDIYSNTKLNHSKSVNAFPLINKSKLLKDIFQILLGLKKYLSIPWSCTFGGRLGFKHLYPHMKPASVLLKLWAMYADKKRVTLRSNLIQTKELEKQSKEQLDNLSDT